MLGREVGLTLPCLRQKLLIFHKTQFALESLKILIIIKYKCEGIAPIKAKNIQIRYILALKHNSEPCI